MYLIYLKELYLVNFKNYTEEQIIFNKRFNFLVGKNGAGKTNILDAIYYLALTKSYFNTVDVYNIRSGEEFFLLRGIFFKGGEEISVTCSVKRGGRKSFKVNNREVEKLSEHVGKILVVISTPYDNSLIFEGSEERRNFLNNIICQCDPVYLNQLIKYNRLLLQRNELLKNELSKDDFSLLETITLQMIPLADSIYNTRKNFINDFLPVFFEYYNKISGGCERVNILYESQLNCTSVDDLFNKNIEKDINFRYSTVGVHKDDLSFLLDDKQLKRVASQGQQKSFLLALKLAKYDFIRSIKGFNPVLLLDDIFDKLDEERIGRLFEIIRKSNFGQVFITDTNMKRVVDLANSLFDKSDFSVLNVRDGKIENN